MRGMGMRASGQNAVGFDYGTPQRSGQASPAVQDVDMEANEEGDDIVIETHRSYTHVIKPGLEQDEAPHRSMPSTNAAISHLLPPSVSDLHARTPSNVFALERAQRAMEGQVAALIPTGPKSAHVHRMYGTLDTVRHRNRQQATPPHQLFPLPASSKGQEKKGKGKFERPAETGNDDPCLAGIPRSTPRRAGVDKDKFFGRGAPSNLLQPIQFLKASGEWRDGAFIRSSDGKEVSPSGKVGEEEGVKPPSNPFDHQAGAGLGFHQPQPQSTAAPLPDDSWAMEREEQDGHDDPIAALLKAHPGSREVGDGEEGHDDSLGYYNGTFGPMQHITSEQLAKTPSEAFFVDRVGENRREGGSDDEDVILIPHAHNNEQHGQMAESDSEEERQLEAIIQRGQRDGTGEAVVQQQETAVFFVDLEGEEEGNKDETIHYERSDTAIVGGGPSEDADAARAEWESDEVDFVNLTERQPRGPGKKARNAAKKARRRAKRDGKGDGEPAVAREGDSDLDWGSDGPPVQFKRQEDQKDFVQGGALQSLNLNGVNTPRTKGEEDDMLAAALQRSVEESKSASRAKDFGAGLKSVRSGKTKDARTVSTKDAILADYMENAMGVTEDDDGEADMMVEQKDDRLKDRKTELDTLLRFMNSMDGQRLGRETTLEDIAIEEQLQEEDEWMTESGSDESEGGVEADAAIRREESRVLAEESEVGSEDSDSSDEQDVKARRQTRQEETTDSDDSDDDEDDAFNRNFSWADADEDFIDRLDKFARAKEGILKGRDRGARNRLFKAIESGDFGMLDDDDMVVDNTDPVFGLGALQPSQKGKKPFKDTDLWAPELQIQWDKDRARKADNKRKRAAERALAAENPFHAQVKKGTKKMAKKAARAERRSGRAVDDDRDDDDDHPDGSGPLSRHAANLPDLDTQIQLFLRDPGKTTLSLAPMDKRARAQVHLLANCYNLTSKSKGNGQKRFPTLIKNQRSGLNVNVRKVNSILRGASGSFGSGTAYGAATSVRVKDRASGAGAHVAKNQEGAAVGFGADRIGEDNVGHRLLTMMGWSEGSGVGLTRGAADPVGATIKVTKSGLGF